MRRRIDALIETAGKIDAAYGACCDETCVMDVEHGTGALDEVATFAANAVRRL